MNDYIDWRIIEKSFTEDLSPEEQEELNRWLEESQLHRKFYQNAMYGGPTNPMEGLDVRVLRQKKEILFRRIDAKKIRQKKLFIRWGSYAACLVSIVGLTLFLTKERKDPGAKYTEEVVARLPALPPGGNKAVLTLSDGRQVALEKTADGVVADDGGKIVNKNNTLIYAESKSSVPVYHSVYIPRGGEYQLVLSDGTEVWLNSCSEIRYPVAFSSGERIVYLSGEAYFDVKKDKRPFKVMVNDLAVKVYGTSFNIDAYNEKMIKTTLVEGRVGLCPKNGATEVTLKPSEQARYCPEKSSIDVRSVDVYDFIAWKQGEFVFNDQTIEEIMNRLSVWYDIDVSYVDDAVKKRKFTGIMKRYATIDKILYYIQETATIQFSAKGKEITVK